MSTNPAPRPALRRSPDHVVHPAAPRLAQLDIVDIVDIALPDVLEQPIGGKSGKAKQPKAPKPGDDKTVQLVITLPKSLRKRLRAKADEHGFTPEEATYHLLRIWVDG
jgi:hypothetical protein